MSECDTKGSIRQTAEGGAPATLGRGDVEARLNHPDVIDWETSQPDNEISPERARNFRAPISCPSGRLIGLRSLDLISGYIITNTNQLDYLIFTGRTIPRSMSCSDFLRDSTVSGTFVSNCLSAREICPWKRHFVHDCTEVASMPEKAEIGQSRCQEWSFRSPVESRVYEYMLIAHHDRNLHEPFTSHGSSRRPFRSDVENKCFSYISLLDV
jgi:hypothetical protein